MPVESQLPSLTDVHYTSQLRAGWEEFDMSDSEAPEACDDCHCPSRNGYYQREQDDWLCCPCWQAKIAPTVPAQSPRRSYIKKKETQDEIARRTA